jgi:hypothetical protein
LLTFQHIVVSSTTKMCGGSIAAKPRVATEFGVMIIDSAGADAHESSGIFGSFFFAAVG